MNRPFAAFAALLALAALAPTARAQTYDYEVWAVATPGQLYRFDQLHPDMPGSPLALTGLAGGEDVFDIWVDPQTSTLYAYGTLFNVYTVDTTTGACTFVGARTFTTADTYWRTEVDPVTNELRAIGTTLANKTISLVDFSITGDLPAPTFAAGDVNAGATPTLTGYAFSSSRPNATSTLAYTIDYTLDCLCLFDPNTGALITVGSLGVDFGSFCGITVALNGKIYASNWSAGTGESTMYELSAGTGAASPIGPIGSGVLVRDIAAVLDFTNPDIDSDGFPNQVEAVAGADMFDPFSVPFPTAPIAPAPTITSAIVKKMNLRLNFAATTRDKVTVSGRLPVPPGFSAAGQIVIIDIGYGSAGGFILDSHGRATIPGLGKFKMQMHPRHGVVKYKLELKHANFQAAVADDGLTNANHIHTLAAVPFELWMPDFHFVEVQGVVYNATAGVRGKARTP